MANIKRQRVFLLGAKNEVVTKAQRRLQQRYPYITFASHHGYVDTHDETVLKRIKKIKSRLYFLLVWVFQNKMNGLSHSNISLSIR